jgi:hypothetical protein
LVELAISANLMEPALQVRHLELVVVLEVAAAAEQVAHIQVLPPLPEVQATAALLSMKYSEAAPEH